MKNKNLVRLGNEYSFEKGYSQVKKKDMRAVRDEIMNELGITTPSSWLRRLYGITIPRVSEAKTIERIFAKYGITEVWGEE